MRLESQQWGRLEELFHAALEREGVERERFLAEATGADPDLARRLGELLAAHARALPGFLDPPEAPSIEGKQLGGFRLLRLLGSGGMGAVYEAEQASPRRRVALKIVRALPGVPRDANRVSLEAEIMSRLRHANIAQIHAAGVLEDPGGALAWFAMELVPDARPLVAFADAEKLDLRARLALLAAVCDGVQHGHQRGVVHLDLKPDNVLVDRGGSPKVIDFGIARAIGLGESFRTLRAAPQEIAGTLAYMSPEQASGTGDAVGTHSDVYALGAILHELLTGARPLELRGRSWEQCVEIVRNESPQRPSQLRRGLARDLDAVVAKALAKQPEERYPTAGALADDLRRFLRNEPVLAHAPSLAHQLRLFARRRRAAALAVVSIAVVLVAATAVSIAFAINAERAANEQRVARVRADRISGLLGGILSAANPVIASGREVTARELVDQVAFQVERELADDPAARSELLEGLAATYYALGRHEQADAIAARAVASAEECGDARRAATSRSVQGMVAFARGRSGEAEALLEGAVTYQRSDPQSAGEALGRTLYRLGTLQRDTGRAVEAQTTLEQALEACRSDRSGADSYEAFVLGVLGHLAADRRDWERAEKFQRDALALQEKRVPAGHLEIANAENSLASTLFDRGRNQEALELWTRALATFEAVLEPDHPNLAAVLGNLALAHQRKRDYARAGELHQRAIELRRSALGPDHAKVATSLVQYASTLMEAGDLEGAEANAGEAVEVARRAHEAGGAAPVLEYALTILALVQQRRGELEPAEDNLREVLASQRVTLNARHPDLAQTLTMLGAVLLARRSDEAALEALDEALSIRREKLGDHWLVANTQSLYGEALCSLGRTAEAEALLVEACEKLRIALGPSDFRVLDAARRTAALYEALGDHERAAQWRGAPR